MAAIIGSACASPSSPSTTRGRATRSSASGRTARRWPRRGGRRRPRPRAAPARAPRAALRARDRRALVAPLRQPLRTRARRPARHLRAVPRPAAAALVRSWGRWAAPSLAVALRRLRRRFPFDLVHAHYAAPAGDAVRRAAARASRWWSPSTAATCWPSRAGRPARARSTARCAARLVLANSAGDGAARPRLGAARTRVVHLGTDVPEPPGAPARPRSSPSATSSRASATPTCCARCGSCASDPRRSGSWSATAPSARRWSAWRASSA